jgi:ribosomal protein S18 acetylase RimI-like enzyme
LSLPGVERHEQPPPPDVLDAAASVYERAFAQPPYSGADTAGDFLDRVARYAERPGFRLALSRSDGDVAAVALSVHAHPGDWWRDRCAATLGPDSAAEWLEPVIRELVHVAVAPERQRRALGRSLTEDTLDDAEAAAVVLSCHPGAEAAKRLYLSCGFEVLATDFRTAPDALGYWLMARRPLGA